MNSQESTSILVFTHIVRRVPVCDGARPAPAHA